MSNLKHFLTLTFLFILFTLNGQGEFAVQIAAYETQVSDGYFDKLQDKNFTFYKDHQRIYHYFVGNKFTSEADASTALAEAKQVYPNAILLDLKKLKECAQCCNPDGNRVFEGVLGKFVNIPTPSPTPRPVYTPPTSVPTFTKTVVNECNLPAFTVNNKEDYERIRTVLLNNPGSSVVLRSCARTQELSCYLSLRDSKYCGIPIMTKQEISNLVGCNSINSCVYVVDVNNKPIDIQSDFRRIIGQ